MDQFLASAEQQQVSPQQIAALISTTFGALCLAEVNGNPMNNAEVDRFVELCHAAIHVGVAAARIEAGWTPGGPN